MKNTALATTACILAAIVLGVLAVLYAAGSISILASSGSGHHYKHAFLLAVLALLALVAANFVRSREAV